MNDPFEVFTPPDEILDLDKEVRVAELKEWMIWAWTCRKMIWDEMAQQRYKPEELPSGGSVAEGEETSRFYSAFVAPLRRRIVLLGGSPPSYTDWLDKVKGEQCSPNTERSGTRSGSVPSQRPSPEQGPPESRPTS